ncbi:ABC transporter permease [Arthrobacter stackebrandtii]|nr:ABC transporter permease [Arthrobacter stackebrandtii]
MAVTKGGLVLAELSKLRTLPLAVLAAAGTVVLGAAISAAMAATGLRESAGVVDAVLASVPFAQLGIILLGILPAAHEYAGAQIRTSLTAVPNRMVFLAAKSVAALMAVSLTAVAALGAGLLAAVVTRSATGFTGAGADAGPWALAGAALYLLLTGLLAYTAALLLRHLMPALVVMLALVLLASPLVGAATEHARWLPDRAGSLLYLPDTDPVLSAGTGALVLLGWALVAGMAAAVRFTSRDH